MEESLKVFIFFLYFTVILIYTHFKNPKATGIIRMFNHIIGNLFSWSFYFIAGGLIGIHYEKVVDLLK